MADSLRRKYAPAQHPNFCKRAWVGLVVEGATIASVVEGSSAHRSRSIETQQPLAKHDVITRVDGVPSTPDSVQQQIRADDIPGTVFRLSVKRHGTGQERNFDIARDDAFGAEGLRYILSAVSKLTNDVHISPSDKAAVRKIADDIEQWSTSLVRWYDSAISVHQAHIEQLEFHLIHGDTHGTMGQVVSQLQHDLDRTQLSEAQLRNDLSLRDHQVEQLKGELSTLKKAHTEADIIAAEARFNAEQAMGRTRSMNAASRVLLDELEGMRSTLSDTRDKLEDAEMSLVKESETRHQSLQAAEERIKEPQYRESMQCLLFSSDPPLSSGSPFQLSAATAPVSSEPPTALAALFQPHLDVAKWGAGWSYCSQPILGNSPILEGSRLSQGSRILLPGKEPKCESDSAASTAVRAIKYESLCRFREAQLRELEAELEALRSKPFSEPSSRTKP